MPKIGSPPMNDARIVIIIQARMESTRLPGKALRSVCGQPMLLYMLDRVSQIRGNHDIVIACPETEDNVFVQKLLLKHGYDCQLVPGDPNDVLARFYAVATAYAPDHVVRLTGDCPLIDHRTIEQMIMHHLRSRMTYTGIAEEWGDGNDMEVFTMAALTLAYQKATLPSEREHVTPFLYNNPRIFNAGVFPCPLNARWLRYSVDTAEDLRVANYLANTLTARHGWRYGWRDILFLAQENDYIRNRMMDRQAMNPAYVEQIKQESGESKTWEEMRYSGKNAEKRLEKPGVPHLS